MNKNYLISNKNSSDSGFIVNSIEQTHNDNINFPSQKISLSDLQKFTSLGLNYPFEGELSTYDRIDTIQVLNQVGAIISATEFDDSGNFYIVGNFNTSLLNFTQTGLNTLGSPVTFSVGTPSLQSSFVLKYDSSNNFVSGKELDFDDNFDYYMVSMKPDGSNFIFLAEKRPLTLALAKNTDVSVFKYDQTFTTVQSASYGSISREILGIPDSFNYGMSNIPANLLQIDKNGKIYVAGVSQPIDFDASNYNRVSVYQESFNFSNSNLTDPFYNNISFSSGWNVSNNLLSADANTNTMNFTSLVDQIQIQSNNNPDLIANWKFDEHGGNYVYDSSGNGLTGSINNAVWSFGHYKSSLEFDGNQDNITIPSSPALQNGNNNFTISSWIKTAGTPLTSNIITKGSNELVALDEYSISLQTGGLIGYGIGNGVSTDFNIGNIVVNDSSWHLITVVFDAIGGNISLYVDGILDTYITRTLTSGPINDPVVIGELYGYPVFNDYSFNGTIDDVRIYNKSLNITEIQNLYANNFPTVIASILDSAGQILNEKAVTEYGVNSPTIEFNTSSPNIQSLVIQNYDVIPEFGQFNFSNLLIERHTFDRVTNDFESFNGIGNEAISNKIPGLVFTNFIATDLTANILAPHSGIQAIYPDPIQNSLISFNSPVSYVSFYVSLTFEQKTVYFQDVDNETLGSILMQFGNNSLIEFGTIGPEIKSIFFTGTPNSYGISIDDFSYSQTPSLVTNDFESFNGAFPTNEPIDNKILGLKFHNWRSSDPISQVQYHSGQNAIYNVAQESNITFDNPVSLVSFYSSFYNFAGFGQQYAVYFLSKNGSTLGSLPINSYKNNSYLSFSTVYPEIKTLVFIASQNHYEFNDLFLDDFSFSMTPSIFVLKLNNDLSINSATSLSDNSGKSNLAITSLALDSNDNIFVSGISSDYFNSNGTQTAYQNLNFTSLGTGFIASFDNSSKFNSLTTLGGVNHSAIYSLWFDNSTLYVGGQSLSDSLFLNPNILLSNIVPSNGSGFLAQFDPYNWNLLYYRSIGDSNTLSDGSVVTSIAIQSNYIYYTGSFNVSSTQSVFTNNGEFSNGTTTGLVGNMVPFVGITNTTKYPVFQTLLKDELNEFGSMSVNNQTGEIYKVTANSSAINVFSIQDTDNDGLSDYNELNNYSSNPEIVDSDADGLSDAIEVYKYQTQPNNTDTDNDCLVDGWEVQNGFNPTFYDANADSDNDGLNAIDEIQAGTSDSFNDTDADGISDYLEVMVYHTNGNNSDSDGDNLSDYTEIFSSLTSPLNNDTDGDKLSDYLEYASVIQVCDTTNSSNCFDGQTDPFLVDTDSDGLSDYTELISSLTIPWLVDTDGDGLSDFQEYRYFSTNGWKIDSDNDGLNDTYEILISQTNATNNDTDYDGLNDLAELNLGTNSWVNDSDFDTLLDGFEVTTSHTDPLTADKDQDGLNDALEWFYGSNSTNNDTDNDMLPDAWEYKYQLNSNLNETYLDFDNDNLTNIIEFLNNTSPINNDTDSDNYSDYDELVLGTNPNNNDTDSDSILDGIEVNTYGTDPLANDSDLDNIFDNVEIFLLHSDPLSVDTDGDGISDFNELNYNTSLLLTDTDNDNLTDLYEITISGTNPLINDTDHDGLADDFELQISNTDPHSTDSDGDTVSDKIEVNMELNPLSTDTDLDGLSDGQEINFYHSNPLTNDTDSDGMPDSFEAKFSLKISENDANEDFDKDGLTNLEEYQQGTDPTNLDTNNNGINDGDDANNQAGTTNQGNPIENFMKAAEQNSLAIIGAIGSFAVGILITLQQLFTKKKLRY